MKDKPDLTITQIEEQAGRLCSSCRIPPETFIIDNIIIPMRFFEIKGKDIYGIFCEQCLSIANKLAKK
jgi:hypothetical protein